MGRLDGSVAFITGAARGMGRSHALRLAEEGADVIALDICRQIDSVPYPLSTPEDLAQTAEQVRALGRRVHPVEADVRDPGAVHAAVALGVDALGGIDVVAANAGVAAMSLTPHETEWADVIDVNLNGVYHTVRAATPSMIERGAGGSIVLISSVAGLRGFCADTPGALAYTASKHALVGLMRAWANHLAPHGIRVNSVHPTGVETPLVVNDALRSFVAAHPEMNAEELNALPVSMLAPRDISHAIAWLVSPEARYVTGVALPVDAGFMVKN